MSAHKWGEDFAEPDEIIPACGVSLSRYLDPRDAEVRLHQTHVLRRPEVTEDFENHTLSLHCFDNPLPTLSELAYLTADFRKRHPEAFVLVIYVSPEKYRLDLDGENFLRRFKFERDLTREKPDDRSFAVSKKMKAKTT